ncbi:hypothetical protein IJG73_03285 [Candidatus Saccharibacteria bacterium]|nr:hypothetical protein [Candidatus Saccharibacteria bacterium]
MPKNYENSSESGGESGWDDFADGIHEEVPFNDTKSESASIDKDFDTRTEGQIAKQKKSETLGRMRAEIFGLFKIKERAAESQATEEARLAKRLGSADRAILAEQEADRAKSEEAHRAREEVNWNVEHYGANIPAETARNGFNKEYYHLRRKIEKEKRAIEKEREMSPKERLKSERKREKHGETVSEEERQHFRELESIQNLGSDTDKENYGRKKERAFRESQENMKADKRRFKKILKERGLSMPKTWNDVNYGLNDLQRIDHLTAHLRQE